MTTQVPEQVPSVPAESQSAPPPPQMIQTFWGVSTTERFYLPDGQQYFEFKPMDEGAKSKFQKMTNRGLRMDQKTQNAHIDVDPANERHTLIRESVVGIHIYQPDPQAPGGASLMPSDPRGLKTSLDLILNGNANQPGFDPKLIQRLEFEIRMANPWMQAEMSLEEMREQRDDLDRMIQQKIEEDAGEASSSGN